MRGSTASYSDEYSKEAWRAYLKVLFDEVDLSSSRYEHLIESVALYCSDYYPEGIREEELALLLARSCCAVGEHYAAERIFQLIEFYRQHASKWIDAVDLSDSFSELLPLLSSKVVHPSAWAGSGDRKKMWVIDFNRLGISPSEFHEIMIFRSIYLLMRQISPYWDGTSGEGILALKGVEKTGLKEDELSSYLEQVFQKEKKLRNWNHSPTLLILL